MCWEWKICIRGCPQTGVRLRWEVYTYIIKQGKAKLHTSKLTSVFHCLPSVGLKQLQGPRNSGFIWTNGFLETFEFNTLLFTEERVQGSEILTCIQMFKIFEPMNWNPLRDSYNYTHEFGEGSHCTLGSKVEFSVCTHNLEFLTTSLSILIAGHRHVMLHHSRRHCLLSKWATANTAGGALWLNLFLVFFLIKCLFARRYCIP